MPRVVVMLALAVSVLPATALAQNAPLAAQGCVGCHGPGGTGQAPMPALAGRPADELAAQMSAFRANQRPGTIMGRIARGYSEAEIASIAAFYAAQPRSTP